MDEIEFISGREELLDKVETLWEKLKTHHISSSPYFKKLMASKSFKERKQDLLCQVEGGELCVVLATNRKTDSIIGYCLSTITMKDSDISVGEISSIFVEERYRNSSIGQELMQKSIDWFRQEHVQKIITYVAVGNESVIDFYKRFNLYPKCIALEQVD